MIELERGRHGKADVGVEFGFAVAVGVSGTSAALSGESSSSESSSSELSSSELSSSRIKENAENCP